MKAIAHSVGGRVFLLVVLLGASIFIVSQLGKGIEIIGHNAPPTPDHGILQATPPDEVAIELTDAQVTELTEAYEHGFNNPEPDDPCKRLQLLPYKKLSAWRKQFRKRGFTVEKIKDMLANGRRVPFTHPEKGVTYTKIFDATGNWIVVDFVDCLIWQVAPYNFK
ncbi:MAG: hypothetical protein J5I98_31745 [Phaeodactylibacter sp.]|nr:hypothetical protein [Phaeodactylibacter sp.]